MILFPREPNEYGHSRTADPYPRASFPRAPAPPALSRVGAGSARDVFGGDVPRMSFAGEWQSEDDTALSMIQGVFHFLATGVSFISASAAFFHDPARAFFEGFSEPGRGLWLAAGAEGAVKTVRNVLLGTGALVAAIIVIAVAASGGKTGSTGASATSSAIASGVASADAAAQNCTASGGTWNGTSCQAATPSPSNTPASPTKVEFIVSGTAPDGIDITYGPDGSQFSGPSTLDGTATMSVPFDGSADYYAIDAQLQGAGSITCKIVATWAGDNPLTVSHGAASGGYNICDAQAAPEDSSGLRWKVVWMMGMG